MQIDFHYYATYCAAVLAGHTHEEAIQIAYSSQFTDCCSATFLKGIKAPVSAATTQLQLEMADIKTDLVSLQNITRIWASFHFLPQDLNAPVTGHKSKLYKNKYRLICGPNSDLLVETVGLAKGKGLEATGLAMHILADTWAHRYFTGTPSLVINNTNFQFYEILEKTERPVLFNHNPKTADDPSRSYYTNSIYQENESSIMNLGHGRAGHLPDYSFIKYRYLPAWGNYEEIIKDNPSEYFMAFSQMVYAMKYLKGDYETFEKDHYEDELLAPYKDRIHAILSKRQLDSSEDWKAFAKELTGKDLEDFSTNKYREEYTSGPQEQKNNTFIGKYIVAAMSQKSMVTNRIYNSKNMLAGFSVDINQKGFKGIKDFKKLVEVMRSK